MFLWEEIKPHCFPKQYKQAIMKTFFYNKYLNLLRTSQFKALVQKMSNARCRSSVVKLLNSVWPWNKQDNIHYHSPTMQCAKEMEDLLTAGKKKKK